MEGSPHRDNTPVVGLDREADNAPDQDAAHGVPTMKIPREPHDQSPRQNGRPKEPQIQDGAWLCETADEHGCLYWGHQKGQRVQDRDKLLS
jgi:hypothetical protein